VREEDFLARLGADEYGVIFVESDRHQALMRADRARRVIAETAMRHAKEDGRAGYRFGGSEL
jgi:PleD family two-component response regulator